MKDPYVVQIPPGATEIDLRSVLEPLALQILAHARCRNAHSSDAKGEVTVDEARAWLEEAAARRELIRLTETITRKDFIRALKALGWTPEDDHFVRWNHYRSTWLTLPRDLSLTSKMDVLLRISPPQSSFDRVEFARNILAGRSVLDAVAWAAEE